MKKFFVNLSAILLFLCCLFGCGQVEEESDSEVSVPSVDMIAQVNGEEFEYDFIFLENQMLFDFDEGEMIRKFEDKGYLFPIMSGKNTLSLDFTSKPTSCELSFMFTVTETGSSYAYQENIFEEFRANGNTETANFTISEALTEDRELLFVVISVGWQGGYYGAYCFGFELCGGETLAFTEVETRDMVDCEEFRYAVYLDWIGAPIVLKNENENTIFECTANSGSLFKANKEAKNLVLKSGEGFYWRDLTEKAIEEDYKDYIDIVLKAENQIVGYAVIEIKGTFPFKVNVLKSVLFPKVGGEYQTVTREYVNARIEEVKKA